MELRKSSLFAALLVLLMALVILVTEATTAEKTCFGISEDDPMVCSARGTCIESDTCACWNTLIQGSDCSQETGEAVLKRLFYYETGLPHGDNSKAVISDALSRRYEMDNQSYPTTLDPVMASDERVIYATSDVSLAWLLTSSGAIYEHGHRHGEDLFERAELLPRTRKVPVLDPQTGEEVRVRKASLGRNAYGVMEMEAVLTDQASVLLRGYTGLHISNRSDLSEEYNNGQFSNFSSIHLEGLLLQNTSIVDVSLGSGYGVLISANGSLFYWGVCNWGLFQNREIDPITGGYLDQKDEEGNRFKAWKVAHSTDALHILGRNGKIVSLGRPYYAGFPWHGDNIIEPTLQDEPEIRNLTFVDIASSRGGNLFLASDRKTLVTCGPNRNEDSYQAGRDFHHRRFLGIRHAEAEPHIYTVHRATIMDALGLMEDRLYRDNRFIVDIEASFEAAHALLDDGSMWILGGSHRYIDMHGDHRNREIWLTEWTEMTAHSRIYGLQAFVRLSMEDVPSIFTIEGHQNRIHGSYQCYGKSSDDESVCNGRGACVGPDQCKCFRGYGSETGVFAGRECHRCDIYCSSMEEGTDVCNEWSGWNGTKCNERIGEFRWNLNREYIEGTLFLAGDQSRELDCSIIFTEDTLRILGGARFTKCVWPSRIDDPSYMQSGSNARNSTVDENGFMRLYVAPFIPRSESITLKLAYPGMSYASINVIQTHNSQLMIWLPLFLSIGAVVLAVTGMVISLTADRARTYQDQSTLDRDVLISEAVHEIYDQYRIIVTDQQIELAGKRYEEVTSALTNNVILLDTMRAAHLWFSFFHPPIHVERHLTMSRRFVIIMSPLLMHLTCVQLLVLLMHARVFHFQMPAATLFGEYASSFYFPWIIPISMLISTITNGIQEPILRTVRTQERREVTKTWSIVLYCGFIVLLPLLTILSAVFMAITLRMTLSVLIDWIGSVFMCWLLEAVLVRTIVGIIVMVRTWRRLCKLKAAHEDPHENRAADEDDAIEGNDSVAQMMDSSGTADGLIEE